MSEEEILFWEKRWKAAIEGSSLRKRRRTDNIRRWKWSEFSDAVNIVYRKNGGTGIWDGMVLVFQWGETDCPGYNNSVIDKLCMDLWYLDKLDAPEDFVYEILAFQLPKGLGPKDLARPGFDPMAVK